MSELDPNIASAFAQTAADIGALARKTETIDTKSTSGDAVFIDGDVKRLLGVASSLDRTSHTQNWQIVTAITKGDLHMFRLKIMGYGYGVAGMVDIDVGGYSYAGGAIVNAGALSRGSQHCAFAWLGFDANERLNVFVGEGISKYFCGITLDVELFHGSASTMSNEELSAAANWQILTAPEGNPGDATEWNGITNIIKVAVQQ